MDTDYCKDFDNKLNKFYKFKHKISKNNLQN